MSTKRAYWAKKKREERDRMRGLGFILRQYWVHPKDVDAVTSMVNGLLEKRKDS